MEYFACDQQCVWGGLFLQLALTYLATPFQQCRNCMHIKKSL